MNSAPETASGWRVMRDGNGFQLQPDRTTAQKRFVAIDRSTRWVFEMKEILADKRNVSLQVSMVRPAVPGSGCRASIVAVGAQEQKPAASDEGWPHIMACTDADLGL